MAGIATSARPPGKARREERAHAFAHEKNREPGVAFPQSGNESCDIEHLRFKFQSGSTSFADVVTSLPAQIERVECIAWNPCRQGMELFPRAVHSMNAGDHRAALAVRPRVRTAGLVVVCSPGKSHCQFVRRE